MDAGAAPGSIASSARSSLRSVIRSAPPAWPGSSTHRSHSITRSCRRPSASKPPTPNLDLRDGPFRLCTEAQPWLHAAQPEATAPRRRERLRLRRHQLPRRSRGLRQERRDRAVSRLPRLACRALPLACRVRGRARRRARRWSPVHSKAGAGPISATSRTHSFAPGRAARPARLRAATPGSRSSPRRTLTCAKNSVSRKRPVASGKTSLEDPRGIFFEAMPPWSGAPVAFLFPGQAAQSPGMLREMAVVFPEVRQAFEEFDRALRAAGRRPVGPLVFPRRQLQRRPDREDARRLLDGNRRRSAGPGSSLPGACFASCAASAASRASSAGIVSESWSPCTPPESMTRRALAELSSERGRLMKEAGAGKAGAMAALRAGPADVDRLIREVPHVQAANWNGPGANCDRRAGRSPYARHSIWRPAVESPAGSCRSRARSTRRWSHRHASRSRTWPQIACSPDHPTVPSTPISTRPLTLMLPGAIAARLGDHLASPVRFGEMIEAMYRDGARVFIEVGPGSVPHSARRVCPRRPAPSGRCSSTARPRRTHGLARHRRPPGRRRNSPPP